MTTIKRLLIVTIIHFFIVVDFSYNVIGFCEVLSNKPAIVEDIIWINQSSAQVCFNVPQIQSFCKTTSKEKVDKEQYHINKVVSIDVGADVAIWKWVILSILYITLICNILVLYYVIVEQKLKKHS